ncbi:MAG: radical SAM protein [Candidatus Omnitrophota bacterium]
MPRLEIWKEAKRERRPLSFSLEFTTRCNNNCRHCYNGLAADDKSAIEKELPLEKIKNIVDEAVSLGVLWCLITGGEPLLRRDFLEVYLYLKRKGLLVSVFTNANLITKRHVNIFKRYPPRDIEVTVYGVTKETYEKITRVSGSFNAFMNGVKLLLDNGIKVRFKAMALRSNLHEFSQIARFCRKYTKDYFRFDPFLHLRFDMDSSRNAQIKSERLLPEEVLSLERSDHKRFKVMKRVSDKARRGQYLRTGCNHLFRCGAGNNNFYVSYDGDFRLCSSLCHPDCVYSLRTGNLSYAWLNFTPRVKDMRSNRDEFLDRCRGCRLIKFCFWCPARAYLETGELDAPVDYYCEIAHARAHSFNFI